MAGLYAAIFLISAVGIAYQIALMRIFSITQWHHFAYMMISIAMLGFGAAGTILCLLRDRVNGREVVLFRMASFLLASSLVPCFFLSQRIPFETFHLVVEPRQFFYLFLLYIVLSVPFLLISACVTLGFFLESQRVARLYFHNLMGSGFGAVLLVGVAYFIPPEWMPLVLTAPAVMAFVLVMLNNLRSRALAAAGLALLAFLLTLIGRPQLRVSPYKALSYALELPDAHIVATKQSPLSQVIAVASKRIRETPGQISNYPMEKLGPLPEQVGLYFDAGSVSVVNRFDGSLAPVEFLDYVTASLPYHLVENPHVLVLGSGGGSDVLMALSHGARHVTAVEVDPSVFPLMRGTLSNFSGGLYDRPDVTAVLADGRGYLQSGSNVFDLIHIALLDSFNASAAGVHALNESYLYTKEAMALYLRHLSTNGVLAITRWLKSPPRDAIKLFASMVEAWEASHMGDPRNHLVMIRSWNTATVLASRASLNPSQMQTIREFCRERWFDISYCPGIRPDEDNRYIVLEDPVYYRAAQAILSPDRDRFYEDYLFYIRPATDDRPYFFNFFKWSSVGKLVHGMGRDWIPFVEWGYIALVATLAQGILVSVLLILLPLVLLGRRLERGARWRVFAYFASLGLAYMFLEIAFIQKFMLFLSYPIFAVGVVLSAFLMVAGLGCRLGGHYRGSPVRMVAMAVAIITVLAFTYMRYLPGLFVAWAGWCDLQRIAASLVLLSPIAFFMGIPFPIGLQWVSHRQPTLVPWAWGINGLASVVGASAATLIAIHFGFSRLVLLAVAFYICAALILRRLCSAGEPAGD